MAEHKYAQALRWLAEGQRVLAKYHNGAEALFPFCFDNAHIANAVDGKEGWSFRLKPRTVKIGSREVEAPVLEPEVGEQVHFMNTWSAHQEVKIDSIRFNPKNNPKAVEQMRAKGLLFATENACRAAHDAIHALLRGESC